MKVKKLLSKSRDVRRESETLPVPLSRRWLCSKAL